MDHPIWGVADVAAPALPVPAVLDGLELRTSAWGIPSAPPRQLPGLWPIERRPRPLLDQPEHLSDGRIVPSLDLADIEPVRHRSTAPMPTRRRPRSALEVLDGAQHQVSVRQWRTWPQQLKYPGSSTKLGQARREVGHHGRLEEERWAPESVLAVPPHDPGERQRRRDHVLDRGRVHAVILAGPAAGRGPTTSSRPLGVRRHGWLQADVPLIGNERMFLTRRRPCIHSAWAERVVLSGPKHRSTCTNGPKADDPQSR